MAPLVARASSSSSQGSTTSGGVLLGAIIGLALLVVICVAVVVFYIVRRRRLGNYRTSEKPLYYRTRSNTDSTVSEDTPTPERSIFHPCTSIVSSHQPLNVAPIETRVAAIPFVVHEREVIPPSTGMPEPIAISEPVAAVDPMVVVEPVADIETIAVVETKAVAQRISATLSETSTVYTPKAAIPPRLRSTPILQPLDIPSPLPTFASPSTMYQGYCSPALPSSMFDPTTRPSSPTSTISLYSQRTFIGNTRDATPLPPVPPIPQKFRKLPTLPIRMPSLVINASSSPSPTPSTDSPVFDPNTTKILHRMLKARSSHAPIRVPSQSSHIERAGSILSYSSSRKSSAPPSRSHTPRIPDESDASQSSNGSSGKSSSPPSRSQTPRIAETPDRPQSCIRLSGTSGDYLELPRSDYLGRVPTILPVPSMSSFSSYPTPLAATLDRSTLLTPHSPSAAPSPPVAAHRSDSKPVPELYNPYEMSAFPEDSPVLYNPFDSTPAVEQSPVLFNPFPQTPPLRLSTIKAQRLRAKQGLTVAA